MDDDIRQNLIAKYGRQNQPGAMLHDGDAEGEIQKRAYALLRGNRYVIMLDIRHKTGDCDALPYHALEAVSFDASGILTLTFSRCEVTLEGRYLYPIYEGLVQHAIRYIQESDGNADLPGDGEQFETVIESIVIADRIRAPGR